MAIGSYLVQRPCRISWDSKVGIQRQIHYLLLRISYVCRRLDLAETIAQKPDAVH